jgi:hypothetical protein
MVVLTSFIMKISFLFFFLLFASSFFLSQNEVKQSLIVVHADPKSKSQFKQQIFSYHFLNGAYVGRDELLSVQGKKDGKDYIRTDLKTNTIYKQRYLITGIGNIIDLTEKKVLFDGKAELVKCSNDSAIFYTNDIFKGKFYSVYNLKKKEYLEVKNLLFKPKLGQDIEFDKTTTPFNINYYPQNKSKILLSANAGYGQKGTKENYAPDPPLFWIDNNSLVYANFNKENTEVAFYQISIDSKKTKLIGKLAMIKETKPAEFFNVSDSEWIMTLGERQISVDLKAQLVKELQISKAQKDFTYDCKSSTSGRAIKLKNSEIGKFYFKPTNFKVDDNIVAVLKEIVIEGETFQQGIYVWSFNTQKWAQIDSDEVLAVIGWIKD